MIAVEKEKLLILSGNYGDGHMQAARAICEAVQTGGSAVEPIIMDVMELTHPFFHPIGHYLFMQTLKKFPRAYGYLYSKSQPDNSFSFLLKQSCRFGINKLLETLLKVRPAMVISTFPPAAGAMSMLRSVHCVRIPSITLITDYTHHSCWVHPGTDHYLVGSDTVKQSLVAAGVREQRISVTGIPIRKEFSLPYNRRELQGKLGLAAELPCLLIMGGGEGMIGEGGSLLKALEGLPSRVQILVVCGRNEGLRRELLAQAPSSRHRVLVHGYVDNVHELMAVSDLIVTKPGGVTVTEALALGVPLVLFRPLPGQEEENARFLTRLGAAVAAYSLAELVQVIAAVLRAPGMLRAMFEGSLRVQKKFSAMDAVRIINQLLLEQPARYEEPSAPAHVSRTRRA